RDSCRPRSHSAHEHVQHSRNQSLSLSLGRPVFESYKLDPLCQAVEAAWKTGIVVVVAAGNSGRDNSQGTNGYATITSTGNDPYVITVGAMKRWSRPLATMTRSQCLTQKGRAFLVTS